MDGYGRHMIANVISEHIKQNVLILILPSPTSHAFQLLDASVPAPLKYGLAVEFDAPSPLNFGRLQPAG